MLATDFLHGAAGVSLVEIRDDLGFGEVRLFYQNLLAAIVPDCSDYRWSTFRGRLRDQVEAVPLALLGSGDPLF